MKKYKYYEELRSDEPKGSEVQRKSKHTAKHCGPITLNAKP